MQPGDVFADRFELVELAGEGGMGAVWRARDRVTGGAVALKVLLSKTDADRFLREAALLSGASHEAIVRHVAHGTGEGGAAFLAMEWLEGEDLDVRLGRGPLTLSETLALGARMAEALASLHARQVVHRDVKPSNVFLVGGEASAAKLLDLGVAHVGDARSLTQTGVAVGTPGYMAPEQARGARDVDERADVFSLGCVIFECLTGTAAFAGEHLVATLAKVLFEDAPRLGDVVIGVPAEIDTLVARMLSKDPDARPTSGAEVASDLRRLTRQLATVLDETMIASSRHLSARPASPLSRAEQGLFSVVLIAKAATTGEHLAALRSEAASHGAVLERLADGSVMAVLGQKSAKDQAARAARLALALHRLRPDRPAVLATGRAAVTASLPVGEAIDRAARLSSALRSDGVRIDETTAGLLDARFEVSNDGAGGVWLRGERAIEHAGRTVLGRAVPCVGRETELALLDGVFHEVSEDTTARVVVVMAPSGGGKSRLVHELLERLRGRGEQFQIWTGQGDPMRAGSPLGHLVDALRRETRVQAGEPREVSHEKIRARVARRIESGAERLVWFVAEMLGVPFDDAVSPQVQAAHMDARLMGDQMRCAFEDLVMAESEKEPLVLLLEDLHWGDDATVSFVESTLRIAQERPFLVVATARPDVEQLFPRLWNARSPLVLALRDLSKKASERLVRAVFPDVSNDALARMVELAAGSALFLEEMVRAAAEGRGGETPGSVLAMVHSRLSALPGDLRLVLRAASVLGRTFHRGAVARLSGLPEPTADGLLDAVCQRELVVPGGESRYPGDREFSFRHEIVREAAYGMLTDSDRALGHRGAAEWLEKVKESDALVVAEHWEKAGEASRAVPWFRRAARQALEGGAFDEGHDRAARGLALGAAGDVRGDLLALSGECRHWVGRNEEARELLAQALVELGPAGDAFWAAAAGLAICENRAGHADRVEALARRMLEAPGQQPAAAIARLAVARNLLYLDRLGLAAELVGATAPIDLPAVRAGQLEYEGIRALFEGDVERSAGALEMALHEHEESGNPRRACVVRANLGNVLRELGANEAGEKVLSRSAEDAERLGLANIVATAQSNLGPVLGRLGKLAEAIAVERQAAETFAERSHARMAGFSRAYLALLLLEAGEIDAARDEARAACEALSPFAMSRPIAQAALARVLLARGEVEEAFGAAREAFDALRALGKLEEGEALVRLAWAEALHATGDEARARAVVAEARDRILARAEGLRAPELRRGFLEDVPEHARTLALAAAWGPPSTPST